jgi:O-antigen/teichoic acid export membrane protein
MGQVCVVAGGVASLKLLAKSLGAAGYGQFAIGLTIAGALGALIYGPISQAATRFWSVAYGRRQIVLYRRIVSGGYLASLLFCALCLVGGTIFLLHSDLYSWLVLFQLSILFAVFTGAGVVAAAVLNATRKRAVLAAHQAAEALLRPVLIVAAVWLLKADARMAMLAYCVTTALVALSMSFFAAKALATSSVESTGPILDMSIRSLTLEMGQYCVPFVLFALLGMAGQYGDRWLLEQWYGSAEVGRYAAMYQLSSWPMIFLLGILNQFIYPIIFARAGDVRVNPHPVEGHSLYRFHILSSALVIAGVAVAAYLFGEVVVRTLTSAQFVADHKSLWIIAIGVALFNVAQQLTLKGMYLNRPSAYIVPKALQSLAFVAIALLIGQGHGIKGVAFAYCASTVIYLGSVWIANRKLSQVGRSGYERLSVD